MKGRIFYVYTLCFPDGLVFYVGKGVGKRIHNHESEARSGVQSKKCDIIRSIWANGEQIIKNIVFETYNESEAYEEERRQISLFGRDTVANRTNGGGGSKVLTAEEDYSQLLCECKMCRQMPQIAEWLVAQRDV